jgi:hypothetical protein
MREDAVMEKGRKPTKESGLPAGKSGLDESAWQALREANVFLKPVCLASINRAWDPAMTRRALSPLSAFAAGMGSMLDSLVMPPPRIFKAIAPDALLINRDFARVGQDIARAAKATERKPRKENRQERLFPLNEVEATK